MSDERNLKTPVFGLMDGNNKRGCPFKEWIDDIIEWCGASLHEVSFSALDRGPK